MTLENFEIATLTCITKGGPANTFKWIFNGVELENEISSNLTLFNVTATDGGAYTCEVTNAAGTDAYTTYVFISPMITLHPNSILAQNGTSEVSLTCNATGFPEPSFEWMKEDGFPCTLSNTTILTIAPVRFGNEGLYYCVATSNGQQVESERATLSSKINVYQLPWSFL